MARVTDRNDKWKCIKMLTSRAFSCPMKPAATGSASPASLSPKPLTWLWEAIRSVLVVDLTSSIFMMSYVQTSSVSNTVGLFASLRFALENLGYWDSDSGSIWMFLRTMWAGVWIWNGALSLSLSLSAPTVPAHCCRRKGLDLDYLWYIQVYSSRKTAGTAYPLNLSCPFMQEFSFCSRMMENQWSL